MAMADNNPKPMGGMKPAEAPKVIVPWHTNAAALVGRTVYIETKDGSMRTGRISGERTERFELIDDQVLGKPQQQILTIPLDLEFNGDPSDRLEWKRIRSIKIR